MIMTHGPVCFDAAQTQDSGRSDSSVREWCTKQVLSWSAVDWILWDSGAKAEPNSFHTSLAGLHCPTAKHLIDSCDQRLQSWAVGKKAREKGLQKPISIGPLGALHCGVVASLSAVRSRAHLLTRPSSSDREMSLHSARDSPRLRLINTAVIRKAWAVHELYLG